MIGVHSDLDWCIRRIVCTSLGHCHGAAYICMLVEDFFVADIVVAASLCGSKAGACAE